MLLLTESEGALQEALAFIDAFEADAATSSSSGDADASLDETTKPTSAPRRKKKRSHTERVKTELERLRNDAEALENTLKRLKQSTPNRPQSQLAVRWSPSVSGDFDKNSLRLTRGVKDPVATMWMEIVVEEFRRRRESEVLNSRLRAMLLKQVGMIQASQAALSSKFTDSDLGLLYEQPKANTTDVQQKALARSLSLRAQQLRQDVDSVLKRTGLLSVDSFLSCSQRKHDGNVGVFFESTYCLPVAFCLEQTRKAFVEQSKCVTAMETMQMGIDAYQLQLLEVTCQQQTYNLSAKSTLRMIQDDDRVVYVWTGLVTLPSRQWTFVEDSIIVVRRASADSPTSLLQNWHRAWMEDYGLQSESDPLKETILSSLSHRVKDHFRAFKSSMEDPKSAQLL